MDSDDDDIYAPADAEAAAEIKMEDAADEDEEEEGEEVEEDDSDDEINFITDSKTEPKAEMTSQKSQVSITRAASASETRKVSATPVGSIRVEDNTDRRSPDSDRPGTDYPGRHTSKINPNGNPVHPVTGKPIQSTDFDTDFPSESTKPWRKPGSDITDYFNYGFDEFTWVSFCLKQQQMPKEIKEINQQAEQMKAFVEGIPGGVMPGMAAMPAAGGIPPMPGMPTEAEMQQMFQGMMSQGMDPSSMDSNQFMQMMMGGAGAGGAGFQGQVPGFTAGPGQQQQQGQGGGFGGRAGRGRGGRRNW